MATQIPPRQSPIMARLKKNAGFLIVIALLIAMPFVVALLDGQSISSLLANEAGQSKFIQGLMIEIFILSVFAISYDLVLGVTGMLSLGHAFFFAFSAYLLGIMLKSFEWSFFPTVGLVIVASVIQALLFAVVLPRVGAGLTFALVTFGMASVFDIIIRTPEMAEYTGADVGLQAIPRPDFLNPSNRLLFYFIALAFVALIYLLYQRFVDSPTGRVCVAIRENENRARMLGYNVFTFHLAALTLSAITAGLAGVMHALYKPIISPEIAGLHYTVDAFLILLIGGMGTLSGAMVGAATFRLLDYGLHRAFGERAGFILGAVYILLVLFVPYGIVGTWRQRSFQIKQGWQERLAMLRKALGQSNQDEER
ncbi:MAG: branched-chain amino acid ABC transporter permease [Anaerolineae bacterium]|nr:branched-chain amino acid ABC transporter permease [Anaerolineae bacterium]